jgi:hypothetical protein
LRVLTAVVLIYSAESHPILGDCTRDNATLHELQGSFDHVVGDCDSAETFSREMRAGAICERLATAAP